MFLDIRDVYRSFGKNEVLKGVSLSCKKGEFVSVIGPSGTGKTTLLKIIAGIDAPSSGSIHIFSEQDLNRNPPILVFQDYMLFPYMNVFENVAFGLRARKLGGSEIKSRVHGILSIFKLDEKAEEYPLQLSGGQQQRVALARALVLQPELILLDEPYANLDRNLKLDTAKFIRDTQRQFGITTICVTHDIEEALASSDSVGVLLDGEMVDAGPPERVYTRPGTLESARFLGEINTIPASLFSYLGIQEKSDYLYTRAETIDLAPADYSPARIIEKKFLGTACQYRIGINGTSLTSRSMSGTFSVGDAVDVSLSSCLRPAGTDRRGHARLEAVSLISGKDETDMGTNEKSMITGGQL